MKGNDGYLPMEFARTDWMPRLSRLIADPENAVTRLNELLDCSVIGYIMQIDY